MRTNRTGEVLSIDSTGKWTAFLVSWSNRDTQLSCSNTLILAGSAHRPRPSQITGGDEEAEGSPIEGSGMVESRSEDEDQYFEDEN